MPQRRVFSEFLRLADVLVMLVALGLALYITEGWARGIGPVDWLENKISPVNVVLLACLALFWPILLEQSDLLRPWQARSVRAEARAVFNTVSLGALLLLLLVVAFGRGRVTTETLAAFWLFALIGTMLVHLAFRALAMRMRRHSLQRSVLVVGSGHRARRLAARLVEQRDIAGYRLLGFVDDPSTGSVPDGFQLVCSIAGLPAFLKENVVDEVVVALPMKSGYQSILEVSRMCEEQGIMVRIPSDLFDLRIANRSADEFGGEPVLTFYTGTAPKPWSVVGKRLLDVGVSSALLMLLAPLFLVTAAAIKLTSRGPVLFRQERLGINKRRFRMLKFRTMVEGAELLLPELEAMNEAKGPVFKLRRDPRLTPIGHWLRKTSIDELPQLINVLKGEMSLVGPRPLPVRDVMRIEEAWQKRRFSVKPGITCLWQVNGRSNVSFQEWVRMDLQYIDKWSLTLDLKILAKTIPAVIRGVGAL